MRTFGSFVVGLLCLAAFAVALPLLWVGMNIADEDGYVALSRSALDDSDTRNEVVASVVDELESQASTRLTEMGVPQSMIDQTLTEIGRAAAEGLAREAVVDAWAQAQRQAHQQMFDGQDQGFVVELAPLVAAAAEAADVDVEVPSSLPVVADDSATRDAIALVDNTPGQATVALGAAVVLGLASVAIAKRRGNALLVLSIAGLIVVGMEYVLAHLAVGSFEVSDASGLGDRVASVVLDVAQSSYDRMLLDVGVGTLVVVVVGAAWAAAGMLRRRRGQDAAL
ncbi:MAG: hypothetical protein QM597_03995 [Aeromicrobium sp.]|uniref:hypothetical protein n=1 Tax=Aeromicrobium sp. TaxID=1871063 RepID=UPI0039E48A89